MIVENIKIVEAARDLLRMYGYFVDNLWHVEDIHFICEQHALPKLSATEAMEIFALAAEQFEGEQGISWPRLEKAVHSYFQRKATIDKLQSLES